MRRRWDKVITLEKVMRDNPRFPEPDPNSTDTTNTMRPRDLEILCHSPAVTR
jgi:hypothetical protein